MNAIQALYQLSYTPEASCIVSTQDGRVKRVLAGKSPFEGASPHCPRPAYTCPMEQLMRLSAACAVGLERVLAGELERLGLNEDGRSAGRVAFTTDSAGIARALVGLRTADRVFLELGSFPAPDFDALFEGIRSLPWERWVGKQDRLVVEKARSLRSALAAQTALQSVAQKAAYERLCAQYRVSRMPDTGTAVATRLRLEDNRATIELDLCGSPLSKRGYRRSPTEAPLKETVAAAVLFLSGWRRSYPCTTPSAARAP